MSSVVPMIVAMLLLPGGEETENPWKAKVPAAVKRAETESTVAALREALDVVWRADDWAAGLGLARLALEKQADGAGLRGRCIRALWRAGRVEEAEKLAASIPTDTRDAVALRMLITLQMARSDCEPAVKLGAKLEALGADSAEDLYYVFATRLAANKLDGLPDLLRKLERAIDARNGYPEIYLEEAVDGLAPFLAAVGTKPLNQIAEHGSAPMTALVLMNLPVCEVQINGRGPYHLILDTGGSILLALDQTVADELGLKSVAPATVRGVSGKQETGQVLVDDLQIGTIKCRRVITRTFDVRSAIMNAADGVLGTGIFSDGRMTLDFAGAQFSVSRSRAEAGAGTPVDLRLVGDAKLMALVTLQDQPAVAMLDTGADVVALSPARLAAIFPGREIQKVTPGMGIGIGSGELPEISMNPGVNLVFAGRKRENYSGLGLDVLDTVLSPVIGVQTDVLVGMPLFREMKSCTVDFPKCKMWVEWLGER